MADPLAIISPKRVEPECSYFGTCGGCAFQDLEYAQQLELKRKFVEDALSEFNGSTPFHVEPTIPSPKPFRYRHMIALTVRRHHGTLRLGFMGHDRRSFLPIESCPIADERINQFIPEALTKLESLPPNKKFRTSQVVLRVGSNGEVVTSLRSDRGKELECVVDGKQFSYSVSSFFQNNFSILESFVQAVRSFLNPTWAGTLLDLYSGVGLLSISLRGFYKQVFGIEEGYEAVCHAKRNAERNQVEPISFLEGKVETLLPGLTAVATKPLHVIVDPPRVGLKPEVIESLMKLSIDRLVYVSCELSALKRDLEQLTKRFQIAAVQPIDLFPQTKHVETIVLLR